MTAQIAAVATATSPRSEEKAGQLRSAPGVMIPELIAAFGLTAPQQPHAVTRHVSVDRYFAWSRAIRSSFDTSGNVLGSLPDAPRCTTTHHTRWYFGISLRRFS